MSTFDPNRKAQAEAQGRIYATARPAKTGSEWIRQNNNSLSPSYKQFFTGRARRPERDLPSTTAPTASQSTATPMIADSRVEPYEFNQSNNRPPSQSQIQPLSSPSASSVNSSPHSGSAGSTAGNTQIQRAGQQQGPPVNHATNPSASGNQNQQANNNHNNSLRGTMQSAYNRGELQPHQVQGAQKMLDDGANETDVRSKLSQAWHYNQWQNNKQNAGPNTTVTDGAPIKGQPNSYGHGVITKNPNAKPGEVAGTVNSTWGKGSVTFGDKPKGRGVNWAEPGKPADWKTQRNGAWVNSGIAAPQKSAQQVIKEDMRNNMSGFYRDLEKRKQRKDPHAFPVNPTSPGELRRNEGNDPSLNSRKSMGRGDLHVLESLEEQNKANTQTPTPASFAEYQKREMERAKFASRAPHLGVIRR